MRIILCLLGFLHIAHVQAQAQDQSAQKIAILIGITKYEHAAMNGNDPLKYPEDDAKAVGRLLAQNNYQVEYLLGSAASRMAISQKLDSLMQKGNADGVALVGFFGHGVQVNLAAGESARNSVVGCFCPYDTSIQYVVDSKGKQLFDTDGKKMIEPQPDSLIKMSDVAEALGNAKAQTRFMIADCCRDLPNRARGRNLGFGANFGTDKLPSQTAMLFGCRPGEQSLERDDWKHGAFTKALLDEMTIMMEQGPVTTGTLSDRVKNRVQVLTGNKQNPTQISLDSIDLKLGRQQTQTESLEAIDDDTIERWIEKGFEFGYYQRATWGRYQFSSSGENAIMAGFHFPSDPQSVPDLEDLPSPKAAFGLSFGFTEGKAVKAETIGQLRRFKNLRMLDIDGRNIGSDTLAGVFRLQTLEYLDLSSGGSKTLTDQDFSGLGQLVNLRELFLYHQDSLTSKVASHLSELSRLEVLDLGYTNLGDAKGLAALAANSRLREFRCMVSHLNAGSGEAFRTLRSLRSLQFRANKNVDDGFVNDIASSLAELEELDLDFCNVSNSGLKHLKNLRNLRKLKLFSSGDNISDDGIKAIADCGSLVELEMGMLKNVKGSSLSELAKLPNLRVLTCNSMEFESKEVIRLNSCRQLTQLTFSVPDLGPYSLEKCLRGLDALRSLSIDGDTLDDEQFINLPELKSLEKLEISMKSKLTDKILDRLRQCRKLQELNVNYVPLTDACIPKLKTMRSLRRLFIANTRLSESGLKQLRESLPNCKIVDK